MDNNEVIIKAHDLGRDTPVNPMTLEVQIFDGENLVAETTLASLVQKFLIVSAEYAKMLTMIKEANMETPKKTEWTGPK